MLGIWAGLPRRRGGVPQVKRRSVMTSKFTGPIVAAGVVMAAAIIGFAIDGSSAQDLKGREIVLGAIVPSSGPFAEWGRANTVTLEMLEKQDNDAGGGSRANLQIRIVGHGNRPAPATNALRTA